MSNVFKASIFFVLFEGVFWSFGSMGFGCLVTSLQNGQQTCATFAYPLSLFGILISIGFFSLFLNYILIEFKKTNAAKQQSLELRPQPIPDQE